jgi:hypothetical protein
MPAHIQYPSIQSVLQQPNSIPSFYVFMSSGEEDIQPENTTTDAAEGEVWNDDGSRQLHPDEDPIEDSDNETDTEGPEEQSEKPRGGKFMFLPSTEQAEKAFDDLANILKPR